MKRTMIALAATVVALLAVGVPVFAHHSFSAEFDSKQQVELQGFVTKVEWTNPHAWLRVMVQDQTERKWVLRRAKAIRISSSRSLRQSAIWRFSNANYV